MEKKKKKQQLNENHKSKSIDDILPLELIHRILVRVPLKHLGRLKCVSKLWNALISDPDFAKSHVHLSAAPTHVCLFINEDSQACFVDIDAVFHRHKRATAVKEDKNGQEHFDCLSLRTNSWTNLDFALSKPLGRRNWQSRGFFLNGAIHWSSCTRRGRDYSILIFDLKERSFSTISMPEQVMGYLNTIFLAVLGGCLALYSYELSIITIWMMKEYKVHSSWIFYQIFSGLSRPLCLSNGSDIVILQYSPVSNLWFAKYDVRRELQFQRLEYRHPEQFVGRSSRYIVYTESLVPVPSEIKDKKKKMAIRITRSMSNKKRERLNRDT
ncbi:F-box/kelch-repeat protein [Arachis hypogaea]|nr:F-box/kelch-repeat protein [Arachis hypogaea]